MRIIVNRIEKIKELKKYIQGLSQEKTHYKDGTTYSDIVIDGKSLCKSDSARKHENQHLRIDKIVESVGDINGKTFIDFGSSSGYMLFRLKELGASRCVGVEGETELVEISNKINDIEKYNDVYFYYKDFISDIDSLSETFDFGIVFSCINSVCSYNDPFFEVPKWLESVGKIVPVLFIEFTEYITNTPWEDEFNTIEITEEQINSQQKSWPTATRDDIIRYFTDKNQESFFKKKTQEMFDNLEVLKSWEHLGISDNNRSIYRLDYK